MPEDKYDIEPMPMDPAEYQEKLWINLQEIKLHLRDLNGQVRKNSRARKDVWLLKALSFITVLLVVGLGSGVTAAHTTGNVIDAGAFFAGGVTILGVFVGLWKAIMTKKGD